MSLQFLPFDRAGAAVAAPYFNARADRFCDRTVGVNYMWRVPSEGTYAITDGCLILRVSYSVKGIHFTYPVGGDTKAALTALEAYCRENGLPLQFAAVSDEEIAALKERYPDITVSANRDFFDYLYHYDDLTAPNAITLTALSSSGRAGRIARLSARMCPRRRRSCVNGSSVKRRSDLSPARRRSRRADVPICLR